MKAFVLAAGLGTRLRPLTDHQPKALVRVGQQPLLAITLQRLISAGFNEIVVNVHHFAEQIKDYLSTHPFEADIRVSDESEALLDTGGGLRRAATLFSPTPSPILVHNVDILHNADLRAFYAAHSDAPAALLVSKRESTRHLLFDAQHHLVGWENTATGAMRSPFPALQSEQCEAYAFSGIHLISPALIAEMFAWPASFSIIDFYLSACRDTPILAAPSSSLQLLDVGKLASLSAAEAFLRDC